MSKEEILAKVKESLSEEEIAELSTYVDRSQLDAALESAKENDSKAARILAEKKATQDKLEAISSEMETLKMGGMSEVEKLSKSLELAQKEREIALLSQQEKEQELIKTIRKMNLDKITNKVKFLDTIPSDMRDYAIEKAFSSVEDLSNETFVNAALNAFKDANKGILASENAPSGTGTKSNQVSPTVSSGMSEDKAASAMSDEERAEHLRKRFPKQ